MHGMPPLDGDETIGDTVAAGTGATELRPAPPSSVDPRGIPTRRADDVAALGFDVPAEFVVAVVTQELDAFPEMPPPSNDAPEDGGAAGLMPGAAISVEPNGTPAGWTVEPDPKLSGDVAPIPADEPPNPFVCATAGPQFRTAATAATAHVCTIGLQGRCTRRLLLISARALTFPRLSLFE